MRKTGKSLLTATALLTALLAVSCAGVPKEIPEDMQPEEYFRNAQTAVVDWGNYRTALFYYEEFINRFPDMKGKVIEAEYEIAFIHYKQENYYESEKMFRSILDRYNSEDSIYFPEWPKILSEKILATIEEESKY